MMIKILLVEDNKSIIEGLVFSLNSHGYLLDYVTTFSEAKKYLENNRVDLIVLDYTLPDGNGFDLYEKIINKYAIPTIFLTAKDDEESIVKGLSIADDYVTKPFSTKELIARINKIILRNKRQNIIEIDDIKFDTDKMLCYKGKEELYFTSLEIQLLYLLVININKIVSRNTILDRIWQLTGNYVDDHTVTTYMNRIRKKLDIDVIKTVKGIGYIIEK